MSTRALTWLLLLTSVCAMPAMARDPADPEAAAPPARYSPVISGSKSYRPVEPLPWGDVNRRVTPPDATVPATRDQGDTAPKAKEEKDGQHGQR